MKPIVAFIAGLSVLCGCSSSDGQQRDYSAFEQQGHQSARLFVDKCQNANELSVIDNLLQVQVNIAQIAANEGDSAVAAFRMGFEEYLMQNNDSLYKLITTQAVTQEL